MKRQALWCEIRFFLILVVAAVMLTGCAAGESNSLFMEGLAYGNLYLVILNPTVRNPLHAESIMKDLLMNY